MSEQKKVEAKKEMPILDQKLPALGVTKFTPAIYEDTEENDIDSILKKELADQGLEYRFIDYKKAMANGGRSRTGWIVYRRQSEDPRLAGIKGLLDSDGLVRQETLVLAVKTKQGADRLRAKRDAQNEYYNQYTKHKTKELGSQAENLNGSKIIAGYENNS